MFVLVLIFVFVGFGLILVGSLTGTAAWAWVSVGVSIAAAAILVIDWARRRTTIGDGDRIGLPDPGSSVSTSSASTSSASTSSASTESSTSTPRSEVRVEDPVTVVFPSVVFPSVPTDDPDAMDADPQMKPEATSDAPRGDAPEPGEERAEPSDLAVLAGLEDEVFVIDEQPRFHLADCVSLAGQASITLPAKEAVDCEFTPCGTCTPVRVLAGAENSRQVS